MKRRIAYKIDKRWRTDKKCGPGNSPRTMHENGTLPWSRKTWARAHAIRFYRDHFCRDRQMMEIQDRHGIRLISSELHIELAGKASIHLYRAMRRAGKRHADLLASTSLERYEGLNLSPSPRQRRRGTRGHRATWKQAGATTGRMTSKEPNLSNEPKPDPEPIVVRELGSSHEGIKRNELLLPSTPSRGRRSGAALALLIGMAAMASMGTEIDPDIGPFDPRSARKKKE